MNRACRQPVRLETLQDILALVVLGAGIAPLISATVGSATLAWFGMQSFAAAWPLWWIGDATGVLIVAPLALSVFHNWRGKTRLSAAQWVEAGVLGLIFLGVAALSLSGYLPFAYIIMPGLDSIKEITPEQPIANRTFPRNHRLRHRSRLLVGHGERQTASHPAWFRDAACR